MRAASPDNVANLIAKPPEEYTPEPRYVSKYRDKVIKASKRGKSAHKTFGVPSVVLDAPGQYRKKRSVSIPKKPEVHHRHYRRPDYQRKLPEWKPVKASELKKQLSRDRVDFTKLNAEEAKNLRPSKARMYCVDDRHGHAYPLMLSGMFPYYRNKKSYGQVPGKVPPSSKRHTKPRASASPKRLPRADNTKLKRSKKHEASPRRGLMEERKNRARGKEKHEASPGRGLMEERKNKARGKEKHEASPRRGLMEERKNRARGKEKHEASPGRGIARGPMEEKKNRARGKEKHEKSPRRGVAGSAQRKPEVKYDKLKKGTNKHDVTRDQDPSIAQTEDEKENDESEGIEPEREGSTNSSISQSRKESNGSKAESSDETSTTSDDEEVTGEHRSSQAGSTKSDENERTSSARTVSAEYQQPRCRYVTEDERAELLYGMKKKWDEMMKEFQCLPFMTDTPPKAKRKSRMEKDLLLLEKDIETIERHPYIYVYSDPED